MGQYIPVTLGDLSPLSLAPFEPGKMALVCEGGGQRGIFTAGVLDEFLRASFNPFDDFFGTSAGAQNLSSWLCGQRGYAWRVITRYTTQREFFDPVRFVRGGHLIDLDWLVDSTAQTMPLAMDQAAKLFDQGKRFYLCACRSDDYTPEYFSPAADTWLDLIRASSAIPGFYRNGVTLNGISYQDGGISDAIPVQEAVRRGAKTVVVIRTVPSQMYYTPQWFQRMQRWLGESSLQPLVNLVQHHEACYSATQQFIESPPDGVNVIEIYPPVALKSMALGSRLPALRADYKMGRLCGRYFLATVAKWLVAVPPVAAALPVSQKIIMPGQAANDVVPVSQANDDTFGSDGRLEQGDSA